MPRRRSVVGEVAECDGARVPNGFRTVAAEAVDEKRHHADREHRVGKTGSCVSEA